MDPRSEGGTVPAAIAVTRPVILDHFYYSGWSPNVVAGKLNHLLSRLVGHPSVSFRVTDHITMEVFPVMELSSRQLGVCSWTIFLSSSVSNVAAPIKIVTADQAVLCGRCGTQCLKCNITR